MKIFKKSVVCGLLAAMFACAGCSGGSSVGSESKNAESDHTHEYKAEFVAPTATEQGYRVYACECGDSYTEYCGYSGEKQDDMNGYSLLFIGNSYTFWKDLPSLFKNSAESAGIEVSVDSVTHGSYTLIKYADENDDTVDDQGSGNGKVVEEKFSNNKYDIVFLQDFSTQTLNSKKDFYAGVYLMNEKVKANGASSVLYQTWARKEGSSSLGNYTVESMTKTIAANYNVMGEILDVPVSPVGVAFYKCVKKYGEIELYDTDYTHPSICGHYLAALVHFSTVYGLSPEAVTYRPDGVDEDTAKKLREIAYDAVFGIFDIEDEYAVDKGYVTKFLQDKVIK